MSGWILQAALVAAPATAQHHDSRQIDALVQAWDRSNPDHVHVHNVFTEMARGTC